MLDNLRRREGWHTREIALFSHAECGEFARRYWKKYGKKLKDDEFALLENAPQTANPLYLQVLLEELRVIGDFRRIKEQITELLQAADPAALYVQVLTRLEQTYNYPRKPPLPELVEGSHCLTSDLFRLLWASRRGLSESELQAALNLAPAHWLPLHAALHEVLALVNRGGLLNFAHDYLRQAVAQRYLSDPAAQQAAHRQLAGYFSGLPLDKRVADECPWQWAEAGDLERLKACISQIPMLWLIEEYELWGYWLLTQAQTEMPRLYLQALAAYEQAQGEDELAIASANHWLADFLYTSGYFSEALPLYQRSLAIFEKVLGVEHSYTAIGFNNLANLYSMQGKYAQALSLHQLSLAIMEKILGDEHPNVADSLNNLAELYRKQGEYTQALSLCQRSLAIREKVLGSTHPSVAASLNNLAFLYQNQGEYEQALSLYQRSLAIRKKVLGAAHPDVAQGIGNLGGGCTVRKASMRKPCHWFSAVWRFRKRLWARRILMWQKASAVWLHCIKRKATMRKPCRCISAAWRFGKRCWARRILMWH